MRGLAEVPVEPQSPERYRSVLTAEQWQDFSSGVERARRLFAGRTIWMVNSTARGGGVAEMLTVLLPYVCGAGIGARWMVIAANPEFFRVTKRIHNHLHGAPGDSPELGAEERRIYEDVVTDRAEELAALLGPGDIVVLHDPQTAGMCPPLRARGVPVVWRCHVGMDTPNDVARSAWRFLLPYVSPADACVFSRRVFAWEGLDESRIAVVPPSIDPFSPKNYEMGETQVAAILGAAGLQEPQGDAPPEFRRLNGRLHRVHRRAGMREETVLRPGNPLVLQVSRWDRLKDPVGVVRGFELGVAGRCDAHLMLAGPSVAEVADDPEGAQVYAETEAAWASLPDGIRARVHLATLPMDDDEENAVMVNALQRRATVVVQKSLAEGFGLTVAEAMWKGRPVVASRIGGIQDQIEHGHTGLLLDDPCDMDGFGELVCRLLLDPGLAHRIGEAAQYRVREQFLGTRHLLQWVDLLGSLAEVQAAESA
ncbi:MAG TPA: glycosyltransferase [Candidatus Dormibacteraeota bacterium]|jgi:trehalose synthase|nr:glycosyltransferase [Candidatus Dormibacteraeota bacterium]